MKKIGSTIIAFTLMLFVFTGCEECIECTFTIPMLGDLETSGEQCGSSSDIDDVQEEWEQLAADAGTTANCVRN